MSQLQIARLNLWQAFWDNLYKEAYRYFALKLYKHADVSEEMDTWGKYVTFGILHKGTITLVNQNELVDADTQKIALTTIVDSKDILSPVEDLEKDILAFTALVKEWEGVDAFVSGLCLFPLPEDKAKEILGKKIVQKVSPAFGVLERASNPDEWTDLTNGIVDQYVHEHQRLIDAIGDRVLQNMLLAGVMR